MSTNALTLDDRVNKLFEQLKERKASVANLQAEASKTWLTNVTLPLNFFGLPGPAYPSLNLQTANEDQIISTAALLLAYGRDYREAVTFLTGKKIHAETHIYSDILLSGYSVYAWLEDCKTRLAKIKLRARLEEIEDQEKRLYTLVSPEQKRQIELELLENEINR